MQLTNQRKKNLPPYILLTVAGMLLIYLEMSIVKARNSRNSLPHLPEFLKSVKIHVAAVFV